ncbi:MAG: hypothetical protein U0M23_05900 [Acutalibacteraceae bacterium]|mgnify:CR=1 FL=1|nr:hypothetical protein [Acutalibacteraceae bacterium]
MITALTIEENLPQDGLQRLKACLHRNQLRTEQRTYRGVMVHHVLYERKRRTISWGKITKALGEGKTALLYSGKEPLPPGLRRYRSLAFMHRMAENGALQVLQTLGVEPYRLKIGLYDPAGTHSGLLNALLPFSACIHAVSANYPVYADEAEGVMENSGAYIAVHKNPKILASCQVIIAPQKIREQIPLSNGCVVFTGQPPAVELPGLLLDRFRIKLPKAYAQLKPCHISDEYFACALYDGEQQYALGELSPYAYEVCGKEMPLAQLCRFLQTQSAYWR